MIPVSDAWKAAYAKDIVPEQFVEISLSLVDADAVNSATLATDGFSHKRSTLQRVIKPTDDIVDPSVYGSYATLETNLWTLDGTKKIQTDSEYLDLGYVSDSPYVNNPAFGYVRIVLSNVATKTIPGIQIVWSSEYDEYPTEFDVRVDFSDGSVEQRRVKNNHSSVSLVDWELTNYKQIIVSPATWNTPEHRSRIDRVVLGYAWTFGKEDIISYSHEQTGDMLCSELSRNSIEFSLDNRDDKWNPYNPTGIGRYLTERQEVSVRYGLRTGYATNGVNTGIEWINAGKFYLCEWDTPSNGIEARFVARDAFEFMVSEMYDARGPATGSYEEMIRAAVSLCEFPNGLEVNTNFLDSNYLAWPPPDYLELVKHNGEVKFENPKYTVAEIIQMCVNATGAVCWIDRDGVLQVASSPWWGKDVEYEIPLDIAYSYPEILLNKPVQYIEFRYTPADASSGYYKHHVKATRNGVTQTIDNSMGIYEYIVSRVCIYLETVFEKRARVSGEFRADPRLDVFDNVRVATKFGNMDLIITKIKYTYNGSFRGEFTAQGIGDIVATQEVE